MSKGQSVSVEKQPLSDDVVPTQSAPSPPQFKVGDRRGTKPIRDFIEGMTGKSLDLAE